MTVHEPFVAAQKQGDLAAMSWHTTPTTVVARYAPVTILHG